MIQGYVVDAENNPIPGVAIRTQRSQIGTVSDIEGRYQLKLEEGFYRIGYTHVAFENKVIEIAVNDNQVVNMILEPIKNQLKGVEVKASNKGLGWQIMKKVIDNKEVIMDKNNPYRAMIYVKCVEKNETDESQSKIKKTFSEVEDEEDSFENEEEPKKPNLNMFEGMIIHYADPPKKMKEERTAVKKYGSQLGLYYTTTVRGEINLYENYIFIPKLGDKTFVSPLNPNGILAYKYKLDGSFIDSTLGKIYRIKISPRGMTNAAFEGELLILGNQMRLHTANLTIKKKDMLSYDRFNFFQKYEWIDSQLFVTKQNFDWIEKQRRSKYVGTTKVNFVNLTTDTIYPKKFFGAELGKTTQEAYDRDTGFWAKIRPEKLTYEEQDFLLRMDSINRVKNSKEYLDSVDAEYNKITARKILWDGVTRVNREKKERWYFGSLPNLVNLVAPGGVRLKYGLRYYKRFENRKTLTLNPDISFGLRNRDIKGGLDISSLYNPIKRGYFSVSFGRDFDVVNGFATLLDLAKRDNFYEKTYLNLYHSREIINGLFIGNSIYFEDRNDLQNFKFDQRFDSLFGDVNLGSNFNAHRVFNVSAYISYTPKQMYVMEPNEKIIVGSKFPTFRLYYKRSIPNVFKSGLNFDYMTFKIDQTFNVGIMGISSYSLSTSKFFSQKKIEITDYIWQRGGDPFFFTPPMFTYQLIDESFPVFDFYFESHYQHQFNGFLTSKVPLLNRLKIREVVGAGYLYVPERNYRYNELLGGVSRIVKIGRNFMRFGIYYVVSESNTVGFRSGFKFSIEPYDRARNTWTF
jgi:hypothetical protein